LLRLARVGLRAEPVRLFDITSSVVDIHEGIPGVTTIVLDPLTTRGRVADNVSMVAQALCLLDEELIHSCEEGIGEFRDIGRWADFLHAVSV
jgi:hypothetical protein